MGIVFIVLVGVYWGKLSEIRAQADVLKQLNLDTIIQVVLFTSIATIVASIIGLVAALMKLKKLLVFYVILIFLVFAVQLAMGILMLTLSPGTVYDSFHEDSVTGYERRQQYQEYMKCCGWDYTAEEFFPDRIACHSLHPQWTTACKQETQNFLDTWVTPIGIALVVVGVFSFIALIASLMVIFSSKSVKEDFFENPFSF